MTTLTQTDLALAIATAAHRGITRMDGVEPYIEHPKRVAERLAKRRGGVEYWVYNAALLHDVVEDTQLTLDDLRGLGVDEVTVELVDVLTKREDETYFFYVERVARGPREAVMVKLADLADNLASLPEGHSLKGRYEKARARLERV